MGIYMLDQVGSAISGLSGQPWLFATIFIATAVVGGNAVFYFNAKRRRLPGRTGLSPFNFPVSTFNGREWLSLIVVIAVSMAFAVLAVNSVRV